MRLRERRRGALGPESQHQRLADHPAGHVPGDHERDPSEHEPLVEIGGVGEREADALGEGLIEGHPEALP
jgi:hypothetical protein